MLAENEEIIFSNLFALPAIETCMMDSNSPLSEEGSQMKDKTFIPEDCEVFAELDLEPIFRL